MQIIKETSRRVGAFHGYDGVCDNCQEELKYPGKLVAIEIADDEFIKLVVPIDILRCPNCNHTLETIKIYKSLNITEELNALKNGKNTF